LILVTCWIFLSFLWSDQFSIGSQNALVFFTFAAFLFLSLRYAGFVADLPLRVARLLEISTVVAASLYGLSVAWWGLGTDVIWGNRTFAMFSLLGLGWFLAGWRHGRRSFLWISIGVSLIIALSLSRAAFLVATLLYPVSQLLGTGWKRFARTAVALIVCSGILILSLQVLEPFRGRFTGGGSLDDILASNAAMYTSGRVNLWTQTFASALESPWIGKGAGSASAFVAATFGDIEHPHNDYLRVFHDYGAVGLFLFLVSLMYLIRACWRNWSGAVDVFEARLGLASLLGLLSAVMMMLTDNTLDYVFVMAPLGVLVGTALGSPQRRRT